MSLTSEIQINLLYCDTGALPRRRRRRCSAADAKVRGLAGPATALQELRELLEATVAGGFDIEEALLRLPSRGVARIALARQVAMYLAHVACCLTKAEAGRLFHRDRTTVHHACLVVEQRRDNSEFNQALDHLERVIKIVVGPQGVTWYQ